MGSLEVDGPTKAKSGNSESEFVRNQTSSNKNSTVRAVFLHILGDILSGIAVIITSIIVKFQPTWVIVDPLCIFIFAIIFFLTVFPVIKSCIEILMECTPEDIDMEKIREELLAINSVIDIHDLHIWN